MARATLGITLVLATALAWAAIAELRAARRTTERISADYLALAGRERVDAAANTLRAVITAALGEATTHTMASVYDQLPAPDTSAVASRALACAANARGGRLPVWYFRDDFRDGSITAVGGDPQDMRDGARRIGPGTIRPLPAGAYQALSFELDGVDRVIVYGVEYAPFEAPAAAYGIVTCRAAIASLLARSDAANPAAQLVTLSATLDRDTLLAASRAPQDTAVARASVAGIALSAYPSPTRRMAGVIVERDVVPPYVLALMLAATVGLGALAVMQLVRERAAVRAQANLVTTISHELRTPLAQILLYAETLALGRTRTEEDRANAARVIAAEARRLADIVNNVVSLARGDRRAQPATLVEPVLRSVIDGAMALAPARSTASVRVSGAVAARISEIDLASGTDKSHRQCVQVRA